MQRLLKKLQLQLQLRQTRIIRRKRMTDGDNLPRPPINRQRPQMPQQFHPIHRLKIQIHQQQVIPKISIQKHRRRLRRANRRLSLKPLLPQDPGEQFAVHKVVFDDQGAEREMLKLSFSFDGHGKPSSPQGTDNQIDRR